MSGPLEGLVVLDLTRYLSGPHCTLLLAGLGARVIKLDEPAGGDPAALAPPFSGPSFERASADDFGLAYLKRARGKRSATLNLKDPRGRALFLRLVEKADVVVENFRPGVAERLGIGYEALKARNPRIVYCALSGYGATGPDKDLKAYDLMAQAEAGLMSITGAPDGPPTKTGGALSDMIAGTYSALGILAALREREGSGLGQAVDVAMSDCLFSMMMDEPVDRLDALGLAARQGNRILRFSPFNAYAAKDGWITLGCVTREDWHALLGAMGREDLRAHPDWSRVEWRIRNNGEVDRLVGALSRARGDRHAARGGRSLRRGAHREGSGRMGAAQVARHGAGAAPPGRRARGRRGRRHADQVQPLGFRPRAACAGTGVGHPFRIRRNAGPRRRGSRATEGRRRRLRSRMGPWRPNP
jgi:crotonobetainyl-CoA:carnitine CoA-transferase CaiB-like acyl-CoA transferase